MKKSLPLQRILLLLFLILLYPAKNTAQSLSFSAKASPNLLFDFNTVQKYLVGITQMNVCELNIEAVGTQWDLYVGATTAVPGEWDVTTFYSSNGTVPTTDMVELRFRNVAQTAQIPGFFTLQDILSPTYIIGSAIAPDIAINCPDAGTNTPGSFITNPQCYRFNVDMKITPGLGNRAGLYTLRIDYVLVQDL
ncbi:hypothetical protein SAMN06265379_104244 [Saccharicrinis carchari]|uniref:Uncharacterized protein n=1 Tax=Saccharicrinis carchari TaxID=1168039 RepID=A0A521D524_SACCC|nr:hypothetical protein [Saccharicrinis carchari]SMO66784.1 hypothetical protein SAMN06265379_104244 [Saccharicrinis carchari]